MMMMMMMILLRKVTLFELWVEEGITRANLCNSTLDNIGKSMHKKIDHNMVFMMVEGIYSESVHRKNQQVIG